MSKHISHSHKITPKKKSTAATNNKVSASPTPRQSLYTSPAVEAGSQGTVEHVGDGVARMVRPTSSSPTTSLDKLSTAAVQKKRHSTRTSIAAGLKPPQADEKGKLKIPIEHTSPHKDEKEPPDLLERKLPPHKDEKGHTTSPYQQKPQQKVENNSQLQQKQPIQGIKEKDTPILGVGVKPSVGGRLLPPTQNKEKKKSVSKTTGENQLLEKKASLTRHKGVVQESLQELNFVLHKELAEMEGTKTGNDRQQKSPITFGVDTLQPGGPKSAKHADRRTSYEKRLAMQRDERQLEEVLERKVYTEEDLDFEQLQANQRVQEEQECYEWIDKAINRILFNTAILVMIAAIMTAFACYTFVQLPIAVYSYHVLTEVFLTRDQFIFANNFDRGFGIRFFAPLPAVIMVMYLLILFFIYLVQYPKPQEWRNYLLNLFIGVLSYSINLGRVPDRLDAFFGMDKHGLKVHQDMYDGPVKLHFLNQSQEYFGCCGFRNRSEWNTAYPDVYGGAEPTYPLSCCDQERSGVACYGPVKEKVVFFKRNNEDDPNPDAVEKHVADRLYEETCQQKEESLCMTVISLVSLLTATFLVLSTWNAIIFIKVTNIVRTKNLEIKQKEQFIDFF